MQTFPSFVNNSIPSHPISQNATKQTCNSYEDQSKPCTEWDYDLSFWRSTLIDEYDLVCDRSWLASLAVSVYQMGYAVSAIGVGLLSDKKGRSMAMRTSVCLEIVASLSQALSLNIYHFLFSRFFLGIAAYGRFLTTFLLRECFA